MRAEKDEILEKQFLKWCALVRVSLSKYEREKEKALGA